MKRSIEQQQPVGDELNRMRRKLIRAVAYVDYMQLDHIEYNPNYVGLFAHVIYHGDEMCFLVSYNHLRRHKQYIIAEMIQDMADRQLRKARLSNGNRFIDLRAQAMRQIRRKAAGES